MPYVPCLRCQFLATYYGIVTFCPVCARQAHYAWAYLKARQTPGRRRAARAAASAAQTADERPWTLRDFDDQTLIRLCGLRSQIRDGAYADDRAPIRRR